MSGAFAERLGWTFVHFIWQGALIGALAASVLALLRRRGPEARYAAGVLGLAAMVLAPVITFLALSDGAAPTDVLAVAAGGLGAAGGAFTWLVPALAWFWLGGAALMQTRGLVLLVRARRLVTRETSAPPAEWVPRFERLRDAVGVRRAVRLLRSTRVGGPMVVGWLRPAVLVPAEVFAGLTRGQLEAVLAHELAHVRRHDFLVNLMQGVAEALLFFHPVVWWLSGRVREEREFCCDDLAVRAGGDRVAFARGLAALEFLSAGAEVAPAVAAHGGPLMKRIERLFHSDPTPSPRSVSAGVPLVVLGVLVGLVPAAGGALGEPGSEEAKAKPKLRWVMPDEDGKTAKISLKHVMGKLSEEERRAVEHLFAAGMSEAELLEALSGSASGDHVKKVITELKARQAQAKARRAEGAEVAKLADLEKKLFDVERKLKHLVASGDITEEQAKKKLEAVRRQLAESAGSGKFVLPRRAKVAPEAEQLERAKRLHELERKVEKQLVDLEAAVKAGHLTKEQAKEKMHALKSKLKAAAKEDSRRRR